MAAQSTETQPTILYVVLDLNEKVDHVLVPSDRASITVCTFFGPSIDKPQGVEVHSGRGSLRRFLGALANVLASRSFDVVHAHSPHVGAVIGLYLLITGRWNQHTVFTAHHSFTNSNLKLRHRLMELLVFVLFDQIVFVSKSSQDSFPRLFRYLVRDRMQVIYNSVDVQRVDDADARWPASFEPRVRIVSVGRLVEIKDPLLLLRAFEKMPRDGSEGLLYVGEGDLYERLSDEAEDCGLRDAVFLTGLVPRDRVYGILKKADLFVSTSSGEGFPVAVLEAMACGCPVVLSDIPPHREAVADIDGIRLVEPGNVEGFSNAMSDMLNLSDGARRSLKVACRRKVEEKFSRSSAIRNHLEMYRRLGS